MLLEYGSKILFSAIEFFAEIMLSFSLFRIPMRYYLLRIAGIAVVMSSLSYYLRDAAGMTDYTLLTLLIVQIILIMILFNLPFLYSLLISFIGFLAAVLIEYGTLMAGTYFNITSIDKIGSDTWHFNGHLLATALVMMVLVYFLQAKKLGFMFIANRFTIRQAVRAYNFWLVSVLLIGIVLLQFTTLSFNAQLMHSYILLALAAILMIGIIASYKQNKKMLKEKYERLVKNEHN
jgi:hypothetical protein